MGRTLAVSDPGESTCCSISHSEYGCKEYTLVQLLSKEIWQGISETQKEGFISCLTQQSNFHVQNYSRGLRYQQKDY